MAQTDARPGLHALNVALCMDRIAAIGAESLLRDNERLDREVRLLDASHRFYRQAFDELRELVGAFPDHDDRTILSMVKDHINADRDSIDFLRTRIDDLESVARPNDKAALAVKTTKRKRV